MIEKLMDFNDINIWNYLIAGILSITILFLTQYTNIVFKTLESNKRKNYFLQFLRYNETIDECINKLIEKSELKTSQSMNARFRAFLIGYFVPIILFGIILFMTKDMWFSVSILALINFLPFYFVMKYIDFAKKNPLENTHPTFKKFTFIKSFLLFSNLIILFFVRLSYLSQTNIELISISLLILSIIFLLGTSYALIKGKEALIFILESSLNELYLDKFPKICIKIINGDICGKLQNIFDDNLLILYYKGERIAIEWDQIITMTLNEKTFQRELDV